MLNYLDSCIDQDLFYYIIIKHLIKYLYFISKFIKYN